MIYNNKNLFIYFSFEGQSCYALAGVHSGATFFYQLYWLPLIDKETANADYCIFSYLTKGSPGAL